MYLQANLVPEQTPWHDARMTALVLGDSSAAPALEAMARGAGFRTLAGATADEAGGRLERVIGVDLLLADCRDLVADQRERLVWSMLGWPGTADARLVALTDHEGLDMLVDRLPMPFEQILCQPSAGEIALALVSSARELPLRGRLNDIGTEGHTHRLDALSEEVRRLAQTIDRLASAPSAAPWREMIDDGDEELGLDRQDEFFAPASGASTVAVRQDEVRRVLQARRLRERYLPGDLFADPAWDMLLDLMAARLAGKKVSVSSLCIASAVPPTTALRWIGQLCRRGIVERSNDPTDARRVFITLGDEAAENVAAWFAAVKRAGLTAAG